MKKTEFYLGLVACLGYVLFALNHAYAELQLKSRIGPAFSASTTTVSGATGERTCISELVVKATSDNTTTVQSSNSILFRLDLASGSTLVRSWDAEAALCSASGDNVIISVSTTGTGLAQINYSGFRY